MRIRAEHCQRLEDGTWLIELLDKQNLLSCIVPTGSAAQAPPPVKGKAVRL